jgi:hypothetical protein
LLGWRATTFAALVRIATEIVVGLSYVPNIAASPIGFLIDMLVALVAIDTVTASREAPL